MRTKIVTVVLLGPAGSFSDLAFEHLEGNWRKKYVLSFTKLFGLLKTKKYYGFVPVKNKIIGNIQNALRILKKDKFEIIQKYRMPIRLVLAGNKGSTLERIKKIYCSKIVKDQCGKFIGRNLPSANFALNAYSSSASFKKIVQYKGKSLAAIGSMRAAKMYKLKVLARNIQDKKKDWTEFWLINKK